MRWGGVALVAGAFLVMFGLSGLRQNLRRLGAPARSRVPGRSVSHQPGGLGEPAGARAEPAVDRAPGRRARAAPDRPRVGPADRRSA